MPQGMGKTVIEGTITVKYYLRISTKRWSDSEKANLTIQIQHKSSSEYNCI